VTNEGKRDLSRSLILQADKHDRVEVGRRIKRLRQAQEMTAQELAKRSGVSPGYLSEVERGGPAVSVDKLRQIAAGLKVGLEALLGDAPAESASPGVVEIPAALSAASEGLNLSHRATLTLLGAQRSLTAKRSNSGSPEWTVEEWLKFYDQVKTYLPER
jgi:transcriptional regulator with XRE-family HTH domain